MRSFLSFLYHYYPTVLTSFYSSPTIESSSVTLLLCIRRQSLLRQSSSYVYHMSGAKQRHHHNYYRPRHSNRDDRIPDFLVNELAVGEWVQTGVWESHNCNSLPALVIISCDDSLPVLSVYKIPELPELSAKPSPKRFFIQYCELTSPSSIFIRGVAAARCRGLDPHPSPLNHRPKTLL